MEKNIAYLPGDGIGPEVAKQAKKAIEAVAQKFGHKFTLGKKCQRGSGMTRI